MPANKIYVKVGPMSADEKHVPENFRETLPPVMSKTAKDIVSNASGFTTERPNGKGPVTGFQLSARLAALTIEKKGNTAIIRSQVNFVLAYYHEDPRSARTTRESAAPSKESMFASTSGDAKVERRNSDREIQYAAEDCVTAVIERLTRKSLPTLKQRAGQK